MGIFENRINRYLESRGDAIGEIQRRIVLFCFECIDGLAGNADAFAKFFLGPVMFGAEDFEPVFHSVRISDER